MHYARRPLIGSASGGVYRHETRTSTKIQPCHGSALRGPDSSYNETSHNAVSSCFIHAPTRQKANTEAAYLTGLLAGFLGMSSGHLGVNLILLNCEV